MANSRMDDWHSPRLEPFLFAPVGADRRGDIVSVVSALARRGVDPWDEAEALIQLSQPDARSRLDSLLGQMDDVPSFAESRQGTVGRLLDLLPPRGPIQIAAGDDSGRGAISWPTLPKLNRTMAWVIVIALLILVEVAVLRVQSSPPSPDNSQRTISAPAE